jgi:hypothetical protein
MCKNSKILSRPSSQTSYHKTSDNINTGGEIYTNRAVCILKVVLIFSLIKLQFKKVSSAQYYTSSYTRYIDMTL